MKQLLLHAVRKVVDIGSILPDPLQPRRDANPSALAELAKSMAQHGQLVDIIVYPELESETGTPTGRFGLADGHRRHQAAIMNKWQSIQCCIVPHRPEPRELRTLQFCINEQREELKPLERLAFFKGFMADYGMKQSELAEWFGLSKSTISNVMRLEDCTSEERELIENGRLGVSAAAALCRMEPTARKQATVELQAGNVTRDDLQARSKRSKTADASNETRMKRFTFELPLARASIAAAAGLSLDQLMKVLDDLVRACKKARADGLDITTLERVLRDRAEAQQRALGGQHVS